MSHIVLKKWEHLKKQIIECTGDLDAYALVQLLLDWALEIKSIKDVQVKKYYKDFLEKYENLEIENILYTDEIWYSWEEIIQIDILNSNVSSYQKAIVKVRDILFNLLAFKSNKICPCCEDDNLRVFLDKGSERLVFECDICLCLVDEHGNKLEPGGIALTFAPISLIKSKNIEPSPI